MKEILYNNKNKVYVKVEAVFQPDGTLTPLSFWWEDGRHYQIDKVIDVTRAASLKAGGTGTRYTIRVMGRQTYLYLEENKWFMERKTCAEGI